MPGGLPEDAQRKAPAVVKARAGEEEEVEEEPDLDAQGKKGKGKKKQRELVFDEDRGQMVARRKRKGSRQRGEWDDYLG